MMILTMFQGFCFAQPYQIGQNSVTFYDPDRNNRSIPTQIFYPAISSGTNVQVEEGEFPVIVFGHGFLIAYSAYQYLWQELVPEGYILAFPTTEGNLLPSHQSFGLDLRFLTGKIKAEGLNPSSLYFGHIMDNSAIMGHSMGGGASFLACDNFSTVSAMITFAAAETNPSAIQAAASIQIPTLIFSGSNDCVTPPSEHQVPMYNNLGSSCKSLISITGGGHCYFADYNFYCAFGEATCSPSPTITREQQHTLIFTHLIPYLDFTLKGIQQSWIEFNNLLNNPSGITSMQSCDIRQIDLKASLEGPFNGTDMNSSLTNSTNSTNFPLSQPYNTAPWNYEGTESVVSIPNPDIVDWVLIEFRDAPDAASATEATTIERQAAFLKNNGSIVGLDGTSILSFNHPVIYSLFAIVRHRNHIDIMSANPLTETNGIYAYDFTTSIDQAYGGIAGYKLLTPGIYGMAGGDSDADGAVDIADKIQWEIYGGAFGYIPEDMNFDGQVNNLDKDDVWILNNNTISSQVPE